jgi:hypothetical protein
VVSRLADYGDDWNGNRAVRVKTAFEITGLDDASSDNPIAAGRVVLAYDRGGRKH